MKSSFVHRILVLMIFLTGCAPLVDVVSGTNSSGTTRSPQDSSRGTMPELPNLGKAPELTTDVWLNTDQTLRLADLRGKVVVIDLWTFG